MLKITCPKSNRHKKFCTTAHVVQEWIVDTTGMFLSVEDECIEVAHEPERGDLFTCKTCGLEAIVEDVADDYENS